ncbi:acyltransferase family protein [Oceanobacillus sp. HCA-5259]|uniref:acyltransferase family protein n=1 Tax=Oceanobacillus sp. HCA-5259 TaxID=3134661 RepID=UPI0030BC9C89
MERNAYFDNARTILIFLVVFGHLIQPFATDSLGMNTLYTWVYIFHMPAFILISGFFARGAGDSKYIWKLVNKLLLPYLIFQMLYTGYYYLIGKADWQASLFYPQWSLWFLISLFCWHILLEQFKKLKPMLGISIALLIGIVVGYFGEIGHTLSLSRTFVFFPFFLIGYWLTEEQFMLVKKRTVKIAGIVIMAVFAFLIYYLPEINTGWLLASKSYGDLGVENYGGIVRLLVYAGSALMVISVLAWIPQQRIKGVTHLGARTIYVYLLHGFFIQYFREAGLFSVDSPLDLIGLAAISAGIVYLLAWKPVLGIFQPLIEGRTTLLREKLN